MILAGVAKSKARTVRARPLPPILVIPVSPITLDCPLCAARAGEPFKPKRGHDLRRALGRHVRLIHVARIERAAGVDLD